MYHVTCKTDAEFRTIFSFTDENKARDYYHKASAAVIEKGGECSLLDGERLVLRCSSPTMTDTLVRSLLTYGGSVKLFDEVRGIIQRNLNAPITREEVERASLPEIEEAGYGYVRHPMWGQEVQS